jgi:hypothetical protein
MNLRIILLLLLLAAVVRILPHPHNFTPLAAMGLFGAAVLKRRHLAFAAAFGALFISDLAINNIVYASFYDGFVWFSSWWQYLSLGLIVLLGMLTLSPEASFRRIGGTALTGSLLFFLVSNFGVWLLGTLYPKTVAGLLACYAAGLPFLDMTILGDLLYSGALFGAYRWASRRLSVGVSRA